ncbi:MAG: 5-methylphenazine-carboxylate 1-monooxygenase [Hyphomicrobiales bacterium]|jgi:2-polyprenyl-6-methoxyphenol hydroxylase-like FAD-dependent oxidoreductase|nr:5-methylphenazine-carboxylate 1-monooxygenase [Hyphomicrobiales bacterium]
MIAIVGGGICGLSLALNLHARGIACRVYEAAPEVKELGVGITLLPHAMRELSALGLSDDLLRVGIENAESCFFNRFGQLIYREPRGKAAGYQYPEVGIHRGKLHLALYRAVQERLGPDSVATNHLCVGVEQDESGARLSFKGTTGGKALPPVAADVVIACDGVNSALRKQLVGDNVVFTGINTWRGVTKHKPILSGRSYLRIGSILTGKIVIYPIVDDVDGQGNQFINWTTEFKRDTTDMNDWNKPGDLSEFISVYESWRFDWLDVADLIRKSEHIFEYPMVDKDPLARWTFGRVTLAGDAAHPMYPRGSNGAAQSVIDARVLADCLSGNADPRDALSAYEAARREATGKVVRTNREHPPDFINIKVEELTGDKPFDNLDDFITQDELRALSDNYKRIAGFAVSDVGRV